MTYDQWKTASPYDDPIVSCNGRCDECTAPDDCREQEGPDEGDLADLAYDREGDR